ncbi:MAG: hypothetical protein HYV09_10090 [Deltaproteobacteria bacterium]|nr:hypothetical protein [Deltaproteobacteria bacterium]
MSKIDELRRMREAQHRGTDGDRPAKVVPIRPDVQVRLPEPSREEPSRAEPPRDEQGKCSQCRKVKPMHGGLIAQHQKGLGKMCPGSRKPPA